MQTVILARVDEMPPGSKKKVVLDGKSLLLTNVQGAYYAIDNRCPHMGGSLFDGQLAGDTITCPKHKTVFDVKTGKVVQNGKIAFINLRVADVQPYTVEVEGENLVIKI